METQTVERRSSSLKIFNVLTTAEIICEPELNRERDQVTYYESSKELVIKKGCFIVSILIDNLPEEEQEQLKSSIENLADLSI